MRAAVALVTVLAATVGSWSRCADPPANMRPRVEALVAQLDVDARGQRDKAEAELLALGPAILEFIPAPDGPEISAEQRLRLKRLIPKLWRAQVAVEIQGKTVGFPAAEVKLREALQTIERQTGNAVRDMREEFNQEASDPTVSVDAKPYTFWQAIDKVAGQAGISIYPFTEDRTVGLVGRPAAKRPVCYAGALRLAVDRLVLQRDYAGEDQQPACYVNLEVLVEPRLRPLLVEIDTASCKVVDDRDRQLTFLGPKTFPVAINGKTLHFPLSLRLASPQRDALRLATFAGEMSLWLPAHVETFVFKELAKGKTSDQTRGGIRLGVRQVEDDGQGAWAVLIAFQVLSEPQTVESHMQAGLDPQIHLRKIADGTRFENNGGFNTIQQDASGAEIEFYFRDAPGQMEDFQLVVQTPVGAVAVPVQFAFSNLELP